MPRVQRFSIAKSAPYLVAVGIVFLTSMAAFFAHPFISHASLSLLFLSGVLAIAATTGLGPSLFSSLLSFLVFNFFFTKPYYTFKVADESDLISLVFFLVMAAITGNLAARMRQEITRRNLALKRISGLYEFSRQLPSLATAEQHWPVLSRHLQQSLERTVHIWLVNPEGVLNRITPRGGAEVPDPNQLQQAWQSAAQGAAQYGSWTFLHLPSRNGSIGLIGLAGTLEGEHLELARSMAEQVGISLDRTRLVADLEQARLVSETEQLRSALLSSVSHDLRTPLASIIGSTSSLLEYGNTIRPEERRELLATVLQEAQRLDRHIQNLLDMTRLGQGKLSVQRDWVDVHDILSSALSRVKDLRKGVHIDIEIDPKVPLLWVQGILIEQALVNLLDNALRFSQPNGILGIQIGLSDNKLNIEICDQGPGIPESEREKIFDMFYTARQGDRSHQQGSGLGLAICRGMIAAHGGSIVALEGKQGFGTCMRILLPLS